LAGVSAAPGQRGEGSAVIIPKGGIAVANRVIIDEIVCKGCGLCVAVCPKEILFIDRNRLNARGYNPSTVLKDGACLACAMCAVMCPDSAIRVERG
jgi:2-oxoglutarate ferredoxin oxidoreductase subunit delta